MLCASSTEDNRFKHVIENVVRMDSWKNHLRSVAQAEGESSGLRMSARVEAGVEIDLCGRFKIHVSTDDTWLVCDALPSNVCYDEWFYFDEAGVPSIYWNAQHAGLLLI